MDVISVEDKRIRPKGQPQGLPTIVEPDAEFEVERILDSRRTRNGKVEYLVEWRGYGDDEVGWEPEVNVRNAAEVVRTFHERHPDKPIGHTFGGIKKDRSYSKRIKTNSDKEEPIRPNKRQRTQESVRQETGHRHNLRSRQ